MAMASNVSRAVGPEVTDEANPGPEGSTTCGTQVGGSCRGSLCYSGLTHSTLPLRRGDAPDFTCNGSCGDLAAPSRTVQGKRLPPSFLWDPLSLSLDRFFCPPTERLP